MSPIAREYSDLETALDDIRTTLTEWAEADTSAGPSADTLRHTRVVLQEWFANLLEHAHFGDRAPSVQIRLHTDDEDVHCVVLDNSEGFDFDGRLPPSSEPIDGLPERGMGLRIMDACTDALSYRPHADGLYRLEFSIPADHDPWLSTPF